MNPCQRFKHLLGETDPQAASADPRLAPHIQQCQTCQALLHAYDALPSLLAALPDRSPPEKLVADLATPTNLERRQTDRFANWLPPSIAAMVVALASLGFVWEFTAKHPPTLPSHPIAGRFAASDKTKQGADSDQRDAVLPFADDDFATPEPEPQSSMPMEGKAAVDSLGRANESFSMLSPAEVSAIADAARSTDGAVHESVENRLAHPSAQTPPPQVEAQQPSAPLPISGKRPARSDRERSADIKRDEPDPLSALLMQVMREKEEASRQAEADERYQKPKFLSKRQPIDEIEEEIATRKDNNLSDKLFANDDPGDLLAPYGRTEGLGFKPAQGYWANTHVPGDPAMRLLQARLAQWDRSALGDDGNLEQTITPAEQPFDPATDHALALQLMSDASAIQGPTRLRLQVGLRGIEHRRGQRPAMNVGVIVDLPPAVSDATYLYARALLQVLLESQRVGDRFSVFTTGPGGGMKIAPGDFRHGTLQAAIEHMRTTATDPRTTTAQPVKLATILDQAAAIVGQGDDPSRPLGSSSLLLITAGPLANIDQLAAVVDQHARAGITLSVAPLGPTVPNDRVERLVLAGLGQRRILSSPDQARALIETELHAASLAVARAARLSIRLAPGVQLIDVVGSYPLNPPQSQQVRAIEQAMDRRLSQNFGIQTDRGLDQDGIQIVIPSIFAGDDVTVLVDVLVAEAGPVADVSLRYKDVVFLRNATLRGQLVLPPGENRPGPAQWAVSKNLLAYHFAQTAREAADALAEDRVADAKAILQRMLDTLSRASESIPIWQQDQKLNHRRQLLERYLRILQSPQASAVHLPLSDSLRLAAWRSHHRL